MESGYFLAGELVRTTDHVEATLERRWSLSAMARLAGCSPFHFHRAFRDAVGEAPAAFVERLRLERAALLLLAGETPITHLAWDVGFRNPETFARRFRKRFGVAARDYRRDQLRLWSCLGLRAGTDPVDGPGRIRVERLPRLHVFIRRRIGEEQGFALADDGVGLTLDWPGITEPGRVRQDEGRLRQADPAAPGVTRAIGDGSYAALTVPCDEAVSPTVYQRLFVWSMAGRYRLRPGAMVEIQRGDEVSVHLPVRDSQEV